VGAVGQIFDHSIRIGGNVAACVESRRNIAESCGEALISSARTLPTRHTCNFWANRNPFHPRTLVERKVMKPEPPDLKFDYLKPDRSYKPRTTFWDGVFWFMLTLAVLIAIFLLAVVLSSDAIWDLLPFPR
jgi:hypothetical protein